MEGLGQLLGGVQPVVHLKAGLAGIERGQLLGLIADDRHTVGLQILQGQSQVQDGLGAGAHHHHRGVRQLLQIGGDVHGGLGSAVHAADSAGGEHLDTRHGGDHHGGGHGGSAVAALRHQNGQIAAAGLGDAGAGLTQIVDLLGGQSGLQPTADDGDGGGHRTAVTNDLLHVQCRLHILGIGHTVGDDGALQRHNGLAGLQSLLHLRGHVQITVHNLYLLMSCNSIYAFLLMPVLSKI